MKLIRYASVYLELTRDVFKANDFRIGDVTVHVADATAIKATQHTKQVRVVVEAEIDLPEQPHQTADNLVIVPEAPRRQTEAAIETMANLFAATEHCHRSISSPHPFVAFLPQSDEEKHWLSQQTILQGTHVSIPKTTYPTLASAENLAALQDRLDGVSILAEALAHRHPTGQFHEFIRLFERAFTLTPSQCEKKLAQFLQGAELGYDRAEIRRWVELRNPATHANDVTNDFIVLESHVRPFIARMEQAAFDVLFNKKTWKDTSKERRAVWWPSVATISADHMLRLTKGADATFQMQILDPFQAFPYDASFRVALPVHAWAKWPTERPVFDGKMQLVEPPPLPA